MKNNQFHQISFWVVAASVFSLNLLGVSKTLAFTPEEAEAIMTDELRLKIVGCAVPGVTRIQIGAEEFCTLELPGEKRFLYDPGTNKLIDVTGGSASPQTAQPTSTTPRQRVIPKLDFGDSYEGTITAQSSRQEGRTGFFNEIKVEGPGDEYTFQANAGDVVTIHVASQDSLESFISVRSPTGRQVAKAKRRVTSFEVPNPGLYPAYTFVI